MAPSTNTPRPRRWRRRLRRLVGYPLAVFLVIYTIGYFVWNDELAAKSIGALISGPMKGGGANGKALVIRRGHWPYFGGLKMLLFGGPVWLEASDASVYDADGKEILHVDHAQGEMYVRETITSAIWSLLPGTRFNVLAHFGHVEVDGGRARIALDGEGKVNLPNAFSPRVVKPPDGGGVRIKLDDADLREVTFRMEMPGWRGEARHVEAHAGHLYASSLPEEQEPDRVMLTYEVAPIHAREGEIVLGTSMEKPYVFPLVDLAATRFAADRETRQDVEFHATGRSRNADARVDGKLTDIFSKSPGTDLTIQWRHGRELAAMLPTGDLIGGDPDGEVRIHGPFTHVVIEGHATGGEVHLAGVTAREVSTGFKLEGDQLRLGGARAKVAGGGAGGDLVVDFGKLTWGGDFTADRVDPSLLEPLVPKVAHPTVAGRLSGRAHVDGSIAVHPERVRVTDVDMHLARRTRDVLPREVDFAGALRYAPERIRLDGLGVSGDGVTATARGEIDPVGWTTSSDLAIDSARLTPLLRRLGLDVQVGGVHAKARVEGSLLEPVADGELDASSLAWGGRSIPRASARIHLEHGDLSANEIRGVGPLGGQVYGDVELGLYDGSFARPRAEQKLHLHLGTHGLSLTALAGTPDLAGMAAGVVDLDGTLQHPTGSANLELPTMSLYGDPYKNGVLALRVADGDVLVDRLGLEREHGGTVAARDGKIGKDGALDLAIKLVAFPLTAIPQLREVPVALGGTLSGDLHVGGDAAHPEPSGAIEATAVKVREILLGDGKLNLVTGGSNAIHLFGEFFRRFKVDGYLTIAPHVACNVTIAFNDFPLEELIPELRKLAEVHGIVSGVATISYDAHRNLTFAELRLPKVKLTIASDENEEDDDRDTEPVEEIVNDGDVVITTDGRKLTFRQARLRSRIGDAEIRGDLSALASNLLVRGQVDLHLLEYFFSSVFQHTHGQASADLRILGNAARPDVVGTLVLDKATLQPKGAERPFQVPTGEVDFDPDRVTLKKLRVVLDDAEAVADGRLELKQWVPGDVAVDVKGAISPTVIAWIYPDHVSEASGRLDVDAHMRGRFPQPTWNGRIDIANLAFHEKRMGRDFRITSGTISLKDYALTFGCPARSAPEGCRPIVGKYDETGDLRIDGVVNLPGFKLGRVDLHLEGDNLDWASPGIYSLTVSPRVDLSGNGDRLKLAGDVTLVAGRYQQKFDVNQLIFRPQRVEETEPPFWEASPLLEQLELDLACASSGPLSIKNNLADLFVSVPSLAITGVLSKPIYDGTVLVEEGGRFQIPLLRADFISDKGAVTFEPDKHFPEETPSLSIRATADWQDRREQIHRFEMRASGLWREPQVDLSSTEGWNKNEVLAALVSGATPDDWRRTVANDPTAKGRSGADQVIKSASQLLTSVIEDPLKEVFRLDLVRFELGSDSLLLKICPWNKRYLKVCGTSDVSWVTTTRYDASGELRLADNLSVLGKLERVEHGLDTDEDIVNRGRLQLTYKYFLH